MPHAPTDTLAKPGRQAVSTSTKVYEETTKTIVQAICSGRSIVAVIAGANPATANIIEAVLEELASRKTRIIRIGPTKVACLGPSSAMDHLHVGGMQVNGGDPDRSKQIVQGLQLIGQPIPGEERRLLVIEEAESIAPDLLENLARVQGLSAPTLPLQLLYVGGSAYWDSLAVIKDGAAKRLIGSPLILLQAPSEAAPVAPIPKPESKPEAVIGMQASPRKARRTRWVPAGLGVLGFSALLAIGLINQDRLYAFIKAHDIQTGNSDGASSRIPDENGPGSRVKKVETDHSLPGGDGVAELSGRPDTTKPDVSEGGKAPGVAVSSTAKPALSVPPETNPATAVRAAGPPPGVPLATPDPLATARTISTAISRGEAMLALHDLSAARRYYELAANAGSADAALALGRTYDPSSLVRAGAVSAQADATLAAEWYSKAAALGLSEGDIALRSLSRQQAQ